MGRTAQGSSPRCLGRTRGRSRSSSPTTRCTCLRSGQRRRRPGCWLTGGGCWRTVTFCNHLLHCKKLVTQVLVVARRPATRPLTCAACSTSCAHAAPPSTSRCTSVARHKPCVRACGRHCKRPWDAAASPAHRRTRRAGDLQPRRHGTARMATWCLDGKSSSCRMKALHARPGAWTAASACALAAALRLSAMHALQGTTAHATACARDRTERLSSATHTRPGPLCSARRTAWRTRARASCKAPAPPSPGVRGPAEPCVPKAGGQGLTGPLGHVPQHVARQGLYVYGGVARAQAAYTALPRATGPVSSRLGGCHGRRGTSASAHQLAQDSLVVAGALLYSNQNHLSDAQSGRSKDCCCFCCDHECMPSSCTDTLLAQARTPRRRRQAAACP